MLNKIKGIFKKKKSVLEIENENLVESLKSYSGDDPGYERTQKVIQTNLDIMERQRELKRSNLEKAIIDPRVFGTALTGVIYLGSLTYAARIERNGEVISNLWQKFGPKGPKVL